MSTKIIQAYSAWIDQEIKKQKFGSTPESLYEPIRYLMSLGGKRLRPVLALLSYSLFKDDVRSVVPYASAVEAFHNFTLMHDDIMDKAPIRRGHPTVHKKWDVNTAILSGDVMLVKVYNMFLPLQPQKLKEVLRSFNKCAANVCEGQQWDMEFELMDRITEKEYINMISLKTGTLLGFSLELGAILADASAQDQKALREFGINAGIGFQLKDDLLDVYGDPKKFGKVVGGDIIANKKTYLLTKALEIAGPKEKKQFQFWLGKQKFQKKEKIAAIMTLYDRLKIPYLTESKIDSYFKRGFDKLQKVNSPQDKKLILDTFTRKLIDRQH